MVGKVAPYVAIGLVQTTVVLALGTWLFRVPVAGSLLDVYLAAVLLILDGVDAPLAIQHFSGWDDRSIGRLAAMHGKRVAGDFSAINASGNRAWLLH